MHWRGEVDRAEQATISLARLPSPYLKGITDVIEHRQFIRWETKRGCAFRCSFCQHRDAGKRSQVEEFTHARLEQEIKLFVAAEVKEIAVLDPIFNDPRFNYLSVLDQLIGAGFSGRLSLQCRFEFVEAEFIERCQKLNVILEFGLQTTQPREWKAIQRGNKLTKVEAAIEALHAAGLDFEVSLIYGLPEQTLGSFRETVDWCLQRRIPTLKAFPLMLLQGTKLDLDRDKWGLRESNDAIPKVIAANSFSEKEHEQMENIAEALIATQGAHPLSVDGLPLNSVSTHPERWSPLLVPAKPSVGSATYEPLSFRKRSARGSAEVTDDSKDMDNVVRGLVKKRHIPPAMIAKITRILSELARGTHPAEFGGKHLHEQHGLWSIPVSHRERLLLRRTPNGFVHYRLLSHSDYNHRWRR